MRFRTGLLVGLAVGYYYGTKAGPERYQQIDQYLAQVRATDAYREVHDRLVALLDDGLNRSRGMVEEAVFGTGGRPSDQDRSPYDFTGEFTGDPTLN